MYQATSPQTQNPVETAKANFINTSGYRFVDIHDRYVLKDQLLTLGLAWDIRGSILLSKEGINIYCSGTREAIDQLYKTLNQYERFRGIFFKESTSEMHSYDRMKVKLKDHIVPSNDHLAPHHHTVTHIDPKTLQQWYEEGRDFNIIDTRNYYETQMGKFEGALDLDLSVFRELPEKLADLPEEMKEKPTVVYCTGGIRCEKGGPIAELAGFKEVYQLNGGIINYFQACGESHYEGDCYVFDKRVAIKPDLSVSDYAQCFVCQHALTPADQASDQFIEGIKCPHCSDQQDRIDALNDSLETPYTHHTD